MIRPALNRRLLVWGLFVGFCTIGMANLQFVYTNVVASVPFYAVLLLMAGLLGAKTLYRTAGSPEPSRSRAMSRIVLAYLLFEVLVVLPVAIWLDVASLNSILGQMLWRFVWLLFPVMLDLGADDVFRTRAGMVAALAAVLLAGWALYATTTGGGVTYVEGTVTRWRGLSLGAGGLLLFLWPFSLAMSGTVTRRLTALLSAVGLVGLVLTNSRSGIIAFAVVAVACLAASGQVRRLTAWAVPVVLAGAVVAVLWGPQPSATFTYTLTHLLDFSAGTGADRLYRYSLAWEFFWDRPFNDYVWSWRYYLIQLPNSYVPHNFIVGIAVFEGLAGLLFYGAVLTTALRRTWMWARSDAVTRALVSYVLGFLAFSMLNANWYVPTGPALLVGALGVLVARVDQLTRGEKEHHLTADVDAFAPV